MEEADANLTVQWWNERAGGVPFLLGSSTSEVGMQVNDLPGASTIANTPGNTGIQTVDATVAAQDAWANRGAYGERLQFLFRFSSETDDDNTAEQVQISNQESFNLLQPAIEIAYEFDGGRRQAAAGL
jgi:hypothetical protein